MDHLSRTRPGVLRAARLLLALSAAAILVVFATIGYNTDPRAYWLMLTALPLVVAHGLLRRLLQRADARQRARSRWKRKGEGVSRVSHTSYEDLHRRYCELTRSNALGFVDERTWTDLGMDAVSRQIDVCFTMAGRNELERLLRHALPRTREVSCRVALAERIRTDSTIREQVAVPLAAVGEERDADPATILWGGTLAKDRLFPAFVLMCALAVLSLVVVTAVDLVGGLVMAAAVFFTNMWIYFRKARHVSASVPAIRVLSRMMRACDELLASPVAADDELIGRLAGPRKATAGARTALRALLTGAPNPAPTFAGDLTELALLYVKIFFQVDLLAYDRIRALIEREIDQFRLLYQTIGTIDAVYALASYRALRKLTCPAARAPGSRLELEAAYHPLVPAAVGNSVAIDRPGAIITGTNMAGKSTFLRTIGINALFAQTAGFAFASSYRAARFRVMSSIEKHDDLAEGKSFYYDEAERIYRMIEGVGRRVTALLLIDELLSGTNSLERESASVAILHYLAERNALTVAATHDVAVARGVSDRYALYYFTDRADERGLSFDYTIQEGIVRTRNAIKLLHLIGYPADVIQAALDATGGRETP